MSWNSFKRGFFNGCGFTAGIGIIIAVIWVGYSFFAKDLVHSGLIYFAAQFIPPADAIQNSTTAQTLPLIGPDTIYEATISYYNQIISILIFIIGIAGVIAFFHIGIISKERAEEITDLCVKKELQRKVDSHSFHQDITDQVNDIFSDSGFGDHAESIELLSERVDKLEQKYDRHDDLLQVEKERKMGEQEVGSAQDDTKEKE